VWTGGVDVDDGVEDPYELGLVKATGGIRPPGKSQTYTEGAFPIQMQNQSYVYRTSSSVQASIYPLCGKYRVVGGFSDHRSGQPLKYTWNLPAEPANSPIRTAIQPYQNLPYVEIDEALMGTKTDLYVTLMVTDFLGRTNASTAHLFHTQSLPGWSAYIAGGSFQRPLSYFSFALYSVVLVQQECAQKIHYDFAYQWTFAPANDPNNIIARSTAPNIYFGPHTLSPETVYKATLVVRDSISQFTMSISSDIVPVGPPSQIQLLRVPPVIAHDKDYTFHVYDSTWRYQNSTAYQNYPYKYYWGCTLIRTGKSCFVDPLVLGFNQSSITIKQNALGFNETVYLSASLSTPFDADSDRIILRTLNSTLLAPTYLYIESREETKRLVPSRRLIFRGATMNGQPFPSTSFVWTLRDGGTATASSLLPTLYSRNATATTANQNWLVITANTLLPNFLYNLTFSCGNLSLSLPLSFLLSPLSKLLDSCLSCDSNFGCSEKWFLYGDTGRRDC